MKILFRSQQDDILKRICALQIMLAHSRTDEETFELCVKHLVEITSIVDGIKGMDKVTNTLENRLKTNEMEE